MLKQRSGHVTIFSTMMKQRKVKRTKKKKKKRKRNTMMKKMKRNLNMNIHNIYTMKLPQIP